eukprot:m.191714 g.191714  ORF g.191714 m.191714 type:complete len:118 (+) comp18431_c0_seq1:230-583(+)
MATRCGGPMRRHENTVPKANTTAQRKHDATWPAWPKSVAGFCEVSFWLGVSDEEVQAELDLGFRVAGGTTYYPTPGRITPPPMVKERTRGEMTCAMGTRRHSIARISNPAFNPGAVE